MNLIGNSHPTPPVHTHPLAHPYDPLHCPCPYPLSLSLCFMRLPGVLDLIFICFLPSPASPHSSSPPRCSIIIFSFFYMSCRGMVVYSLHCAPPSKHALLKCTFCSPPQPTLQLYHCAFNNVVQVAPLIFRPRSSGPMCKWGLVRCSAYLKK